MDNNINEEAQNITAEDITREWLENLIKKNSDILGLPKETYKNILNICVKENALDISNLEEAILSADYERIRSLTHKLIGVFSNLQLEVLAAPSIEIDGLAKKKTGFEEIKNQFHKLKNAFEKMRALSST